MMSSYGQSLDKGVLMIDLHLHLLPAVDDGPRTLDESLALARALVESGVRRAVVTPHFDAWTAQILPNARAIGRHTDALRTELAAASIPLAIVPGGECFLTPELLERAESGDVPSWGRPATILVETAEQHVLHAERMLAILIHSGLRVVLAHPERYAFIQENPAWLDELVGMGLLVQVTAGAFRPGASSPRARTAELLLRQGRIHALASDAHNAAGVRGMQEGLARLGELAGAEVLALLTEENPAAILDGGRAVRPAPPVALPARRRVRLPFSRR